MTDCGRRSAAPPPTNHARNGCDASPHVVLKPRMASSAFGVSTASPCLRPTIYRCIAACPANATAEFCNTRRRSTGGLEPRTQGPKGPTPRGATSPNTWPSMSGGALPATLLHGAGGCFEACRRSAAGHRGLRNCPLCSQSFLRKPSSHSYCVAALFASAPSKGSNVTPSPAWGECGKARGKTANKAKAGCIITPTIAPPASLGRPSASFGPTKDDDKCV